MADEKPTKPRKTTTRAPRKRVDSSTNPNGTSARSTNDELDARSVEAPVLAIGKSSELDDAASGDVDEIRRAAYELYLSRGGSHGSDLSDWLEAERIVRRRRGRSAPGSNATDRTQGVKTSD